jgi:uncharacterized membrane protein YvbJ
MELALTRTNKKVLIHYLKASNETKKQMLKVLKEQIDNLNLLYLEMENKIL